MNTLPLINACLNGLAAILLTVGWIHIRRGNKLAHRNCMISAFVTSCVFLTLYLIHKYLLHSLHTPFRGPDFLRLPYLVMLTSHIILAIAIVPLVLITMRRGLRDDIVRHRKIARWTFPIWMYVSVTGVLVYLVLYQIWPAKA
ncbi:MAG TPA: DUF420 domain-containing protein [Candidatus Limnocylindria bacterium]|nr:DUF420 domain-containing protein [Candidatus Limnocylindria bacterium]